MYEYTIIIPHRNIPKLLQRCLDSIPRRDDIQIIVVDDNSDTDKVDFSRFPGLNDPYVEVYFDKSGKGAGRARNVGLEYAKGKWLIFADADDFFNYCIRDILDEYSQAEADIIFFDSNSVNSDTYVRGNRSAYTHSMITLYDTDPAKAEFQLRYYLGVPWSKIVSRSMVENNHICFDETPINNDTTFAYMIGLKASTITVDKRALYCVTNRSGSISVTITEEKTLASIEVFTRKYRVLLNHGIDFLEDFAPTQLKSLRRGKNKDLYKKGLEILHKYGFDESFIDKPCWTPPLFDVSQESQDFLSSYFGRFMEGCYYSKGLYYKLFITIIKFGRLIRRFV